MSADIDVNCSEEERINRIAEVIGVQMTPLASSIDCEEKSVVNDEISDSRDVSGSGKRKLSECDCICLRRKVSDNESVKVYRTVGRYAERCALRCYLNNGGTPAEYPVWRTKLPESPLTSHLETSRLDPDNPQEDLYHVLRDSTQVFKNSVVTRSSIKTIIASSTPVSSKVVIPKTVKLFKSTNQTKQDSKNDISTSEESMAERAKQEAYVMQRIGELQRDGLWPEKRLPKTHEPPRPKAHWDYLLEEMVWLSADFNQERKWKKASAKKCAKMVQKYFQEKESNAQKAVRAKEIQLKRIASIMAKEVRQFWSNIEKLVEFKQQTRIEEKRKKALDQHLSFIVDQTEKYSSLVAESMNNTSALSSKQTSPKASDDEFEPDEGSSDDEETIAKEEAMSKKDKQAINDEIKALQKESELPLEDLLADYLEKRDEIPEVSPGEESSPENNEGDESDDEFNASSDDDTSDDEETIQEQEDAEGTVNHNEELIELEADNNLSIEELKMKYKIKPSSVVITRNSIIENGDTNLQLDKEEEDLTDEEEEEPMDVQSETEETLKSLFDENKSTPETPEDDKDKEMNDVAALAQSLQPKGNTLSSTDVVTKVPFLLKHTLREYQHIGLDWLVTMYDRKLNGILADEMGLGKTIQTIALLAHLACEKGNWGPHLIVVPTSVMLNWEMEFKKWCPGFKILTYYGSIKERRYKRIGWTKPNAFHVCITSYKLIIQDHTSFRRKKWKYLILDEAQNIKNFKSQRWQLLLNFQTQRRLLLTGTPLQNNLMELWSLMHFLMPSIFESHREFKEWFSNPVTGMIEGNAEYNENIIRRLHKVLRPFLLRRLKSEVETQMPKKYEHVVICRLSNRQRYLYDDFMSRAKTRETLASGNMLSVINVLMQLRKVCNHPNLFEVRPTVSPFHMEAIVFETAFLVTTALDYDPFKQVDLSCLNYDRLGLEKWLPAFVAHRAFRYKTSRKLIEEIDTVTPEVPPCPKEKIKISVQWKNSNNTVQSSQVTPSSQPYIIQNNHPCVVRPTLVQVAGSNNHRLILANSSIVKPVSATPFMAGQQTLTLRLQTDSQNILQVVSQKPTSNNLQGPRIAHIVHTPRGKQLVFSPQPLLTNQVSASTVITPGGQRLTIVPKQSLPQNVRPIFKIPPVAVSASQNLVLAPVGNLDKIILPVTNSNKIETNKTNGATEIDSSPPRIKNEIIKTPPKNETAREETSTPPRTRLAMKSPEKSIQSPVPLKNDERIENIRRVRRKEKLNLIVRMNERRCSRIPVYGMDIISSLTLDRSFERRNWMWTGHALCSAAKMNKKQCESTVLSSTVLDYEERLKQLNSVITRFVMYVPAVYAPRVEMAVTRNVPWKVQEKLRQERFLEEKVVPLRRLLHPVSSAMQTQFPDRRLIQYDCGKLQSLDALLRRLKTNRHRALIFTQMTRMLDILEAFLNYHGHIYLRLDGTTKVEQRQVLMERFNNDRRIFCFILSTRSGGVGVNLTGADTVIFYDSDWNPTMDAQAQDRCHRIGQTRDVNIYRLISEKTVEENILKKANQKRMLGDLAIEGGNFTTAYFKSTTIQDLFNVDISENDASRRMEVIFKDSNKRPEESVETEKRTTAAEALESALAEAEDESDVAATKVVQAETEAQLAEFDENIPIESQESQEQLSKAELELQALAQQLSGIEKYAMRFVEEVEAGWAAEQMAIAEAQLEEVKRGWEASRTEAERDDRKRKSIDSRSD